MRQTAFFFLLLFIQTGVSAQTTDYRKQQNYKEWVHLAPKFNDAFFRTEEAQRIGDNVLLYQQVTGGWPKNIYMPAELTEQEYTKAWNAKGDVNQSTIDNNATTTEIQYLARLYQATQKEKYKEGVLKGIQYLLKAQYDNGGWPQFYPRPTSKSPTMITQWSESCSSYGKSTKSSPLILSSPMKPASKHVKPLTKE